MLLCLIACGIIFAIPTRSLGSLGEGSFVLWEVGVGVRTSKYFKGAGDQAKLLGFREEGARETFLGAGSMGRKVNFISGSREIRHAC